MARPHGRYALVTSMSVKTSPPSTLQNFLEYCSFHRIIRKKKHRVALLMLPLLSGRYPHGNLLPEIRWWGVHSAHCRPPPHGRLLLLCGGSLGYGGMWRVSREKHAWVWGALPQRTWICHKRNYKWKTFLQRYNGFSGWLPFLSDQQDTFAWAQSSTNGIMSTINVVIPPSSQHTFFASRNIYSVMFFSLYLRISWGCLLHPSNHY